MRPGDVHSPFHLQATECTRARVSGFSGFSLVPLDGASAVVVPQDNTENQVIGLQPDQALAVGVSKVAVAWNRCHALITCVVRRATRREGGRPQCKPTIAADSQL